MDREQKATAVAELTESLKQADSVFAVDYRGISVSQAAQLRRNLADADAVFTVVKNRLAKRAVAEAGTGIEDELLIGPTALTLINGDAVVAAKAISSFTKEHDVLQFKGGLMDGAQLDPEGFTAIVRLPGLEVMHGQLVGLTASPLTGLVTGLGSMISGLAIALGQIAEQGLVSGEEAPPAEEEAPEEAEEEAPEEAEESPAEQETPEEAEQPETEDEPEATAEAETSEEPAEAPEETDDNEAGSSEESEPEGDDPSAAPDAAGREADTAPGSDSGTTTEEE